MVLKLKVAIRSLIKSLCRNAFQKLSVFSSMSQYYAQKQNTSPYEFVLEIRV